MSLHPSIESGAPSCGTYDTVLRMEREFLGNEIAARRLAIAGRFLLFASACTIDEFHDDATSAIEAAVNLIEQPGACEIEAGQ